MKEAASLLFLRRPVPTGKARNADRKFPESFPWELHRNCGNLKQTTGERHFIYRISGFRGFRSGRDGTWRDLPNEGPVAERNLPKTRKICTGELTRGRNTVPWNSSCWDLSPPASALYFSWFSLAGESRSETACPGSPSVQASAVSLLPVTA